MKSGYQGNKGKSVWFSKPYIQYVRKDSKPWINPLLIILLL